MVRRVRRLALLVVALLVVAAVVIVLTGRPPLAHDRARADQRWRALRQPLSARYEELGAATEAVKTAGGGARAVIRDLDDGLARWAELRKAPDRTADTAAEVTAANRLEGLGVRLRANVDASARLKTAQPVVDGLTAFDVAKPTSTSLDAYDAAARRYQKTRDGVLTRYAAMLLGFGARPTFELAGSSG